MTAQTWDIAEEFALFPKDDSGLQALLAAASPPRTSRSATSKLKPGGLHMPRCIFETPPQTPKPYTLNP